MAIKNKNIKEDSNPIEESGRAHSSSATPIVTPTLPTTSTLKIMPWFWGGVVASIPTLLFLGNSRQMDSLIGIYSISYFLINNPSSTNLSKLTIVLETNVSFLAITILFL